MELVSPKSVKGAPLLIRMHGIVFQVLIAALSSDSSMRHFVSVAGHDGVCLGCMQDPRPSSTALLRRWVERGLHVTN